MLNLEALNNLLMFVVTPLAGAFVALSACHQTKSGVLASILFAIGGLLLGIVSALATKPIVDSVVRRALRQTSMVGSSLLIGAGSLVVLLQILVVVIGVVFLASVIL
jgi:hypothetical protein